MKISVEDYQKIAKSGNYIATNGDGGMGSNEIRGTVTKVLASEFFIQRDEFEENDLWCVQFTPVIPHSIWVEVLKKVEAPQEDKRPKVKKKIYITLEKDAMGISISLKIPEEIEEYYKSLSKGELQLSKGWFLKKGSGAPFYKLNEDALRNEKRIDSDTFSDFGNGLLRNDDINTAILRTVGASEGIKITSEHFSSVNNIDLEYYVKRLGSFTKRLWETSISKKVIKSVITFEI